MMDEITRENRLQNLSDEPVAHFRSENIGAAWRAMGGAGFLALVVTLFGALIVSNRDYAKAVGDNLRTTIDQWDRNFQKLGDRVYDLERWAWSKGKR